VFEEVPYLHDVTRRIAEVDRAIAAGVLDRTLDLDRAFA
jgi:hypothetical protein